MKPSTIATTDGIFTLDASGFYVPLPDPEPKTSGLWLYAIAIAGLGIVAGVVWAAIHFNQG